MNRRSCCPRCRGEIRLDRDEYGWYEECLMCGYMHDLQAITGNGHLVRCEPLERREREVVEAV